MAIQRSLFSFPVRVRNIRAWEKIWRITFRPRDRSLKQLTTPWAFQFRSLCFAGPAEALQLTENTQPAILTVSIAALRALESAGVENPDYVAGHSLGEYSALVAAGAISLEDAVRTVRARGRYMQEAVPAGEGAMAAVLGASLETIEEVCAEVRGDQVCAPANINSANQIVIAGNTEAVDRAGREVEGGRGQAGS